MNSENVRRIADQFRRAWLGGNRPQIDQYLEEVGSSIRNDLAKSLVEIDIEQRAIAGESVGVDDYDQWGPAAKTAAANCIKCGEDEDQTIAPGSAQRRETTEAETIAGTVPKINSAETSVQPKRFLHFELLSELARGGMGVVYRARDTKLNRIVALKMILSGQLAGAEARTRFNLEAEAAANLDHPNITPVYEIGEHDGQPYFAMKLVEGGSLADHLQDYVDEPRKSAQLLADVADAVHHAHQRGTLHRDLKPNNILIDLDGNPLITDFGLAKLTDNESEVTRTGAMMGTPGYMPPEQAASGKDVTTAADIYSLGAILFATLTGRPPFQGSSPMETVMQAMNHDAPKPSSINIKSPLDLELIAMKCLERDPKNRYATADNVASDLRNWLNGDPISVRAPSLAAVARQWVRRNIQMAMMSLLIGFVVAAIATPFCLTGFGQSHLPGTVYEILPLESRNVLAGLQFGLPKLEMGLLSFAMVLFAVFLASSAGAIAVAWLKPKSMNESVGIGIISGVAVAITLFLLVFGWLFSGDLMGTTRSDFDYLVLDSTDENELANRKAQLLWRYPDLKSVHESEWQEFIKRKIGEDTALNIFMGNLLAAVMSGLFFLPVALAAAYYFQIQSRYSKWLFCLLGHLEFVGISVLLSFAIVWLAVVFITAGSHEVMSGAPRPSYLALITCIVSSTAAIYLLWNFKPWWLRTAANLAAISIFALVTYSLLDETRLWRDIEPLLESGNYAAAANRMEYQQQASGSKMFSATTALALAARSTDQDLHQDLQRQFVERLGTHKPYFQTYSNRLDSAPLLLEVSLLTPDTESSLNELDSLIEFVEKFATPDKYDVFHYYVLGLAKFRAGDLKGAKELLDYVSIDISKQSDWPYLARQKSLPLKAVIHHRNDEKVDAAIKFYNLQRTKEFVEKFREQDGDKFWWRRQAALIYDILDEEATKELSQEYSGDDWFNQYMADVQNQTLQAVKDSPENIDAILERTKACMLQAHVEASNQNNQNAKANFEGALILASNALKLKPNDKTAQLLALESISEYLDWPQIFEFDKDMDPRLVKLIETTEHDPNSAYSISERIAANSIENNRLDRAMEWTDRLLVTASRTTKNFGWTTRTSGPLEENMQFFHYQSLDKFKASVRIQKMKLLEKQGKLEDAISLGKEIVEENSEVIEWSVNYFDLLNRTDPERAAKFIGNLRSEDAESWKRNSQLIKWTSVSSISDFNERSQKYGDLLEKHLANSNIDPGIKSRIQKPQLWKFVGPFDSEKWPEVRQKLFAIDGISKSESSGFWNGEEDQKSMTHQPQWRNNIDLGKSYFAEDKWYYVFGLAKIESDRERNCKLVAGNQNGIFVWVNQESVIKFGNQWTYTPEYGSADITLNKGINYLLVRVDVYQPFSLFKIEIEDEDGWPADIEWLGNK